jgi:hypothetical protein
MRASKIQSKGKLDPEDAIVMLGEKKAAERLMALVGACSHSPKTLQIK